MLSEAPQKPRNAHPLPFPHQLSGSKKEIRLVKQSVLDRLDCWLDWHLICFAHATWQRSKSTQTSPKPRGGWQACNALDRPPKSSCRWTPHWVVCSQLWHSQLPILANDWKCFFSQLPQYPWVNPFQPLGLVCPAGLPPELQGLHSASHSCLPPLGPGCPKDNSGCCRGLRQRKHYYLGHSGISLCFQ